MLGDVANFLALTLPAASKLIDGLVIVGFATRELDPDDRRKVLMFISDRGKVLCKKLNSLAVDQEEHILESYGDKSTSELKRLLESLIDSAN